MVRVDPLHVFRAWKTWDTGVAPSFALEVVSLDWRKDYEGAPERYAALDLTELIVFDPYFATRRDGIRFQRHARDAAGHFALRESSNADRMNSSVLGGSLVVIGKDGQQRLRIADRTGNLFPTEAEDAHRAKDEAVLAKDEALARVAALEAQLKRR